MATDTRNAPAYLSNDADFQTWVAAVHAQFAVAVTAGHLVVTGDTGQINPAIVTRAGVNTAAGYEIYRLNDSNQSSYPVYFKVEYGQSAAATNPCLWLTVGTGSNGSGTLTGQLGTRKQCAQTFTGVASQVLPSYFCSRADGFVLVNNYLQGTATAYMFLLVERTKDGSGAATTDGIITLAGVTGGVQQQTIGFVGPVPTANSTGSHPGPSAIAAQGAFGANIAIVPLMNTALGQLRFGLCAMVFKLTDLISQAAVSTTNLGSTHTYLPLTSAYTTANAGLAVTSDAFAVLYE
jgi:hypothetical protein